MNFLKYFLIKQFSAYDLFMCSASKIHQQNYSSLVFSPKTNII